MKTKLGLLTLLAFGATTAAFGQSVSLYMATGEKKSPLTSIEVCDWIASEGGGVPVVQSGVFTVCDSVQNSAFIDQCNAVLVAGWASRKGYNYYKAQSDSVQTLENVLEPLGGVVEFSRVASTGLVSPTAPITCLLKTKTKSNQSNDRVPGKISLPDLLGPRSLDARRVWISIEDEKGSVLLKPISVAPFRLSRADAGRNLPGDDNIISVELSEADARMANNKHPDLMKRCRFVLHYGEQCDIVGESYLISRVGPIKGAVIKGGYTRKYYVGHVTLIKQ